MNLNARQLYDIPRFKGSNWLEHAGPQDMGHARHWFRIGMKKFADVCQQETPV